MKTSIDIINEHIRKDIIDMLEVIKNTISTNMSEKDIFTVAIYADTIAALVSEDIDMFPQERTNA